MEKLAKTRVLIVNDDGVNSANLRQLAAALSKVAEVFVFAPENEQSGVGQAFTVRKGLRIVPVESQGEKFPYEFYSVSGTPADCAKFALGHFAKYGLTQADNKGPGAFDVCFSGVNVGENAGVSSLYSGTVAGAREACLWGVPAVAISLRGTGCDMLQTSIRFAEKIVVDRLFESIGLGTFWNVNFPKTTEATFKGFKATTMALTMFTDHYDFKDGLWQLDGDKLWDKNPAESDDFLLDQGYATITPHQVDQTDSRSFEKINEMINKRLVGCGAG